MFLNSGEITKAGGNNPSPPPPLIFLYLQWFEDELATGEQRNRDWYMAHKKCKVLTELLLSEVNPLILAITNCRAVKAGRSVERNSLVNRTV